MPSKTFIITMINGRRYRVEDCKHYKYRDNYLVLYDANRQEGDRFATANIEHVAIKNRSSAELIEGNTNDSSN